MIESERAAVVRNVVVAGDVAMDWNIAHQSAADDIPTSWNTDSRSRICWQRGGAALLGELTEAVAASIPRVDGAPAIRVFEPLLPRVMPCPGDPDHHHSHAIWSPYAGGVWRVRQYLGFERARPDSMPQRMAAPDSPEEAEVLVLDDAGLGFRDTPESWPAALTRGTARWIVAKLSRPVARGPLWEHLLRDHAEHVIAVMTVDDLRLTEVQISRGLSWERTAQDVVWELTHNPRVNGLSRCAHTVVSFGTTGAVLLSGRGDRAAGRLVFEPSLMEGGWEPHNGGGMIGNTATLTAAIVRECLRHPAEPDLPCGIVAGITAMRRLYQVGYCGPDDCELAFPVAVVTEAMTDPDSRLAVAAIQDPVQYLAQTPTAGAVQPQRPRVWTILEDRYSSQLDSIAEQIVREGLGRALAEVPCGQIGALVTVDRQEIESLRSIQNLMGEYCRHKQKRPLSIAVFGPPGSGKSFGVEQVAASVCPGEIRTLTFNLSQFARPEELHGALHQVRDVGLSGKIPLVFWDEFDTPFGGQALGWLRYFLAPMQDGSFQQGEITHPIGRSVFVFAGGTSFRFANFGTDLAADQQKSAKVPDFISRLKGYLDVLGPNPVGGQRAADPYCVIRRALLLRSLFERLAPRLLNGPRGMQRLNIDAGVLRAFLQTREYRHGIRSMESIIAMSMLSGHSTFERSALPAQSQLEIHVDSLDFLAHVQQLVLTDELTERLAAAAHEVFREGKERDKWTWGPEKCEARRTHPLLLSYDKLSEDAREANRVTVRTIPQKLAMARYVMLPARSNEPPLEFPGDDLEQLAGFEHDSWMQSRLAEGYTRGTPTPQNPRQNEYLVPWDQVPEAIREIDRDLVRGIPRILAKAGYAVVKLERA